ncbi:alpha/beta hydrolase [Rhodopseudomonas sp. B29]|uniref:alpha/beta hydrolase n=1 Tax=Rhodopseudomonas sp. B29 TaxID=95607 RepID=UPI00034D33B1|nr:hypothetical protein [Rhodopseudomonas sp. B29]
MKAWLEPLRTGCVAAYVAAALLSLGVAAPAAAQTAPSLREQVLDLTVAEGETQRVLYVAAAHPKATLVMLPGGAGDLGLNSDGHFARGDNFLVRTRGLWVAQGFAVVIPDAVDGDNLRGVRSTPAYAEVIRKLVDFARARSDAPIVLVGTSQGSIAAMNGAAHLRGGEIAGVVLTESVSRLGGSRETVFDAHPERVDVPTLVVANADDRCDVAPPGDAPKIAAALTGSRRVKLLTVSGGDQRSPRDCGSLTPHGYYGIEPRVVSAISQWVRTLR